MKPQPWLSKYLHIASVIIPSWLHPRFWTGLVWTNEMIKIRRFSFQYQCWNVYFLDFRPLLKKNWRSQTKSTTSVWLFCLTTSSIKWIYHYLPIEKWSFSMWTTWGQIARILNKPFKGVVWYPYQRGPPYGKSRYNYPYSGYLWVIIPKNPESYRFHLFHL